MKLVIVTGMSGAGKTIALKMLEDLGFYCVDNLPISLADKFVQLVSDGGTVQKAALGIDIRSGEGLKDLEGVIEKWRREQIDVQIIFLDASNTALIKRYKETRRSHPLAGKGPISFRELAGYPYGTFRGAMNQQVRHLLAELPAPQVFTVEDIGPLRQMLLLRNAYTVIPRRALRYGNNFFRSQLAPLELKGRPLSSRMILIWNSAADNRTGAAIRRELAEYSKDYLEQPE